MSSGFSAVGSKRSRRTFEAAAPEVETRTPQRAAAPVDVCFMQVDCGASVAQKAGKPVARNRTLVHQSSASSRKLTAAGTSSSIAAGAGSSSAAASADSFATPAVARLLSMVSSPPPRGVTTRRSVGAKRAPLAAIEILCLGFCNGASDVPRLDALAQACPAGTAVVAVAQAQAVQAGLTYGYAHGNFGTRQGFLNALSEHTSCALVDWFWMQCGYYRSAYGVHWVGSCAQALASFPRLQCIVLPVDAAAGGAGWRFEAGASDVYDMLHAEGAAAALAAAGATWFAMTGAEALARHPLVTCCRRVMSAAYAPTPGAVAGIVRTTATQWRDKVGAQGKYLHGGAPAAFVVFCREGQQGSCLSALPSVPHPKAPPAYWQPYWRAVYGYRGG